MSMNYEELERENAKLRELLTRADATMLEHLDRIEYLYGIETSVLLSEIKFALEGGGK